MYTLRTVFQVISLAKSDMLSNTKTFVELLTYLSQKLSNRKQAYNGIFPFLVLFECNSVIFFALYLLVNK